MATIHPESDDLPDSVTPPATTGSAVSTEAYRALVESVAQAVWETDAAGKITTDSPAWRAFTGQTREEWLEKGWEPVVHPDERAQALQQWQESLRRQTPMNAEFRLRRPDGNWQWANVRAVPIRDAGGSVNKWVGMAVRQSRQPGQTLNESQELLRTLIEHLPGGAVFLVDHELRYLLAGGEAMQQVGMKPGNFIGKTLAEAVGPALGETYKPLYQQALNGMPFTNEHEVHGRQFLTHGIPLRNAAQASYAVLAVSYDITERKKAEESLRESEANYRSVFDMMDEGYLLCEVLFDEAHLPADIVYVSVNSAATRMVGQDLTGQRLREISPAVDAYWYDLCGRVVQTGTGERLEQYVQPANKWYDLYVFKAGNADNRVAIVFRDITGQKRREAHAALLARITDEFSYLSSAEEIMRTVGEQLGTLLQLATVNFIDIDASREEDMTVSHSWNRPGAQPLLGAYRSRVYFKEDFLRAAQAGEISIVRDTASDPRLDAEVYALHEVGAWLGVPFHRHNEWKFYFSVTDTEPRDWRDDEIDLFRQLANQIFPRIERMRTEEALRQQEERTRIAIEAANMGTWEWTLPTNKVYWNEQHFLLFGLKPHKQPLSPDEFMQHVHPDDLDQVKTKLQQTIEHKTVYDAEFRSVRDDGSVRWMSGYGRVTGEMDGQPVRLSGVMFDIDDRQRSHEALRQSEERLRIVMASITDHALITVNTQNVVTGWNQGAQKLFGYSADEAIGQPGAFIYTPEDQTAGVPEQELNTARQEGRAADERYHVRQDGSRIYVSGVQSPLYDTQEQLLGYVKVARDLTQRQQMEQTLRDAARRKDEFLAMLAHELRNPLAPIRNILQALQLTDDEHETIGPAVAIMSRQVDHLVRLIDDLLDVSRINRGKIELRRERLDFSVLVQQAAEAARPLYHSQGRHLEVHVPTYPIYLQGDATRLTQVVTNLLTNGARYTHPEGHVSLTLTVTEEPSNNAGQPHPLEPAETDPRPVAVLRVRDDGIGLSADQLEQIFDLFVQVDTTLDRSQGGLGLGLTLVRQLVDMHDGRVEARSAGLNQGSEFIVTLPILQKPIDEMNVSDKLTTATTPGHRILVVDDNRDAADTLAILLKLKKHRVQVRYSGREALEAGESLQPDVILLDISMPEMDGYQTARLIRQQPWGQNVLLISLTGYGQQQDKQRSLEAGFDSHLVKPVDLAVLTQLFQSLPARPNDEGHS